VNGPTDTHSFQLTEASIGLCSEPVEWSSGGGGIIGRGLAAPNRRSTFSRDSENSASSSFLLSVDSRFSSPVFSAPCRVSLLHPSASRRRVADVQATGLQQANPGRGVNHSASSERMPQFHSLLAEPLVGCFNNLTTTFLLGLLTRDTRLRPWVSSKKKPTQVPESLSSCDVAAVDS